MLASIFFDLSRDFLGHSKLMFLFFELYHFMLSGNFCFWLGNSGWDFLGDKVWS